jgi:outer membrane protein
MLNAEQQIYHAQRDLIQARHDTLPQGLKQKAAAGVLSEDNLATIDRMLGVRGR